MASPKPIRDASGKITDYEFPDSTSPYYTQVLKPPPPGVTSGPRPALRDAPPQPAPPSQPMGPPEVDANYLRSMLTMGKASGPSAQPMSRAAQMQQIRDRNARIQQESRARNQQIRDQNIRIQQESRLRNQQVRQPMQPSIPRPGQVGSATGATPNIGGFPTPGATGLTPAYSGGPQKPMAAGAMLRKGGPVKAKAPVKKAMGGKVAAKPVAKKAGGKVAAKPMAKPVMKKAGGRVAMKPKMKRK